MAHIGKPFAERTEWAAIGTLSLPGVYPSDRSAVGPEGALAPGAP
ncbi:hypothetical protein M2167_006614 [Streptomyces sp. SPB4]|nr:hypothetical protein [Streptomyces sp. SPB4]